MTRPARKPAFKPGDAVLSLVDLPTDKPPIGPGYVARLGTHGGRGGNAMLLVAFPKPYAQAWFFEPHELKPAPRLKPRRTK